MLPYIQMKRVSLSPYLLESRDSLLTLAHASNRSSSSVLLYLPICLVSCYSLNPLEDDQKFFISIMITEVRSIVVVDNVIKIPVSSTVPSTARRCSDSAGIAEKIRR